MCIQYLLRRFQQTVRLGDPSIGISSSHPRGQLYHNVQIKFCCHKTRKSMVSCLASSALRRRSDEFLRLPRSGFLCLAPSWLLYLILGCTNRMILCQYGAHHGVCRSERKIRVRCVMLLAIHRARYPFKFDTHGGVLRLKGRVV